MAMKTDTTNTLLKQDAVVAYIVANSEETQDTAAKRYSDLSKAATAMNKIPSYSFACPNRV